MKLELSAEETEQLVAVLESWISEMGPELRHSMNSTFKEELKQKRTLLRGILGRLEIPSGHPVGASESY